MIDEEIRIGAPPCGYFEDEAVRCGRPASYLYQSEATTDFLCGRCKTTMEELMPSLFESGWAQITLL
jgi:hypothetical protein